LLLILVAVVLLATGLAQGSNTLLIGSIAVSLLAAMTLVVGARQAAASRVDETGDDELPIPGRDDEDYHEYDRKPARMQPAGRSTAVHGGDVLAGGGVAVDEVAPALPGQDRLHRDTAPLDLRETLRSETLRSEPADPEPAGRTIPAQAAVLTEPERDAVDDLDDEDPPDEPAAQLVSAADAARVARIATDVLVIDGRPRYHLAGCVHLLGRESEPLPATEAVELGFTPCSLCEPDSALLAEARRV
jgi:hypothetical protein